MDQIKIGRFIAACRKEQGLTQMQLAEQLNITDRAVSKWETGRAMPDSAIMLDLCALLHISVTDLLCGEVVSMEHHNEEMERNLLDAIRQKEEADKRLLTMEILTGIICILPLLAMAVAVLVVPMKESTATILTLASIIPLLIATPFMIRIEQTAGYYVCKKCGHHYVPTYQSVLWAPHINRTRYMRCPHCGKWSWQKKVLSKE